MDTELRDLFAFLAVVRAGGFREGARASGSSASRLSDSVRRLESRMGVRLLHRTTRSVVPTEAGARLAERLVPALGEVEAALDVVNHYRNRPAGTLRLNVPATVARLVLPSIVTPFLQTYPEIRLEVIVEDGFVDLVAAGCDAGVRYDERLEQDMIAVPIGPPLRMAVVGSPAYFAEHGKPRAPQDLTVHRCINQRMVSSGGLYVWDFARRGQRVNVRVDGPLIFNTTPPQIDAALAGLGLTLLPEDELSPHLQDGSLVRVLQDWCPPFDGYHLYYPSRRQPSPAFSLVVEALRWREAARS